MTSIDEENWYDVSYCSYEANEQGEVVLDISGGGSNAWSYVLKWDEDDEEDEPNVYLWSYPFGENKKLIRGKTLVVRSELESACQSVAEVDKGYEREEEDDDYCYSGMYSPNI